MIKILINYSQNKIKEIIIDGHAFYDSYGKDIVCASVSSITTTTINAIIRLDDKAINYQDKDGFVKIEIINHNKEVDILIENMLDLFKQLESNYSKNIKINEEVHPC